MIPETVLIFAFGIAMAKPPTRHEGWMLTGHGVGSLDTEPSTMREYHLGADVALPSQSTGYLTTDRPIDPVEWLNTELDSYGTLNARWDGPRSVPPEHMHIDDAKRLVSLLPAGLPLPKAMLSADGEVALYWRTEKMFADAVMEGDGKLSLFVTSKTQNPEHFEDDLSIDDAIGSKLLHAFQQATNAHSTAQ